MVGIGRIDQKKRYLKSIMKDKKGQFYLVLLIFLSVRAKC